MFGGNVAPRTSVVDPRHRDEISAPHSFHLTSSLFRRASRSSRIPPPPPQQKNANPRSGAHFFVEAEEEKKGGPLRQKFISGKDEFPTYTCLKMCSNDTLSQGSAAREARRLRPFLWHIIRPTTSKKSLHKLLCSYGELPSSAKQSRV